MFSVFTATIKIDLYKALFQLQYSGNPMFKLWSNKSTALEEALTDIKFGIMYPVYCIT